MEDAAGRLIVAGPAGAARIVSTTPIPLPAAPAPPAPQRDAGAQRRPPAPAAFAVDAVLVPEGVFPTLAAAFAAIPAISTWAKLTLANPAAAARARDASFSGMILAPTNLGIDAYLKRDKVPAGSFLNAPIIKYLLFFHSSPEPYSLRQVLAAPPASPLRSGLSILGTPAPIFHGTAPPAAVAGKERGGGGGGGGGSGGGGEGPEDVYVWGALNVRDHAKVISGDYLVGAGTLHVIDNVLLPDIAVGSTETIKRAVDAEDELSVMARLLQAAGLAKALDAPLFKGTLLAPSDEAFKAFAKKMGFPSVDAMLNLGPLAAAIAGVHLIPTSYDEDGLRGAAPVVARPFKGGELTFEVKGPQKLDLAVSGPQNGANLVKYLEAGRSFVHVIDQVLLPNSVFFTIMDALSFFNATSRFKSQVAAAPALAAAAADPKTSWTVFAPTDAAYAALPGAPPPPAALVVPRGALLAPGGFEGAGPLRTLSGDAWGAPLVVRAEVDPSTKAGEILVYPAGSDPKGASKVVQMNLIAGRSAVHGVDRFPLTTPTAPAAATPAAPAAAEPAAAPAAAPAAPKRLRAALL
ncbi:hypothetical protein MNEG_9751 [Monoraphidium neglectum]|uniref:FAS1 domain-containing protein n=1 Tax=Monoraphidium neglectum TaxID=145388 RepID=A0A0D2MV38_9CHLO|nr:hypothetical protein MNEG_9751 [Monoraphidium neglectum]KIY98210.1 hypothetical protein MNEG_9751 [Monoraphidium neglectum]|eukprot:XP_013897230.1 hypothetical protein MNEG_9751 [Monoraphidium neglectum]